MPVRSVIAQNEECAKLEKQLCNMIDEFSHKYCEKARNFKHFPEVARELKELKKEIKRLVDEAPLEKGVFNFYISQKADLFSSISDSKPILKNIEHIVITHPLEEYGFPQKLANHLKNMLSNHAIILDALAGRGEKSAQEQVKQFAYIARSWDKHS